MVFLFVRTPLNQEENSRAQQDSDAVEAVDWRLMWSRPVKQELIMLWTFCSSVGLLLLLCVQLCLTLPSHHPSPAGSCHHPVAGSYNTSVSDHGVRDDQRNTTVYRRTIYRRTANRRTADRHTSNRRTDDRQKGNSGAVDRPSGSSDTTARLEQ